MKDKIYYCNITGEILLILASLVNVKETSFDEDYLIYSALNKRTKNSISLIELDFGEFSKLSQGSTDIIVDLRTKELNINSFTASCVIDNSCFKVSFSASKMDILFAITSFSVNSYVTSSSVKTK